MTKLLQAAAPDLALGPGSRHWEWALARGRSAPSADLHNRADHEAHLVAPDVYIRRRLLAKGVVCAPLLHLTSLALTKGTLSDFMEMINLGLCIAQLLICILLFLSKKTGFYHLY